MLGRARNILEPWVRWNSSWVSINEGYSRIKFVTCWNTSGVHMLRKSECCHRCW